ncbi:MAG: HAMP domain-containing sensor histidine kinase [Bacillota bacterium]|nr:HAMP domain-containing sensor histidine kinase [Bacillota bacterium]
MYPQQLPNPLLLQMEQDPEINRLLSTVCHEIRNPVSVIMGIACILRNTGLTEKQEDLLCKMERASSSLLSIADEVLDFSSLKAGNLVLRPSLFSLKELTDDLEGLLAPSITQAGLEWRCVRSFPAGIVFRQDRVKLFQLLLNLLRNAYKYTLRGSIALEAGVLEQPGAPPMLRFAVRDTGIGIPEENLPEIFEEFRQVDHPLNMTQRGSGLGLPLCRRIAEAMGGRITVSSQPGQGSCFEVILPTIPHLSARDCQA